MLYAANDFLLFSGWYIPVVDMVLAKGMPCKYTPTFLKMVEGYHMIVCLCLFVSGRLLELWYTFV